MTLKSGDPIPDISLKDKEGKLFSLSGLKGKAAVIYFYPRNFTPGCTTEACDFRDKYEDFKDLGAEVVAISADSEASHRKFVEQYNLPFIFLSDPENKAKKAFGVKASLLGIIPGRETFVFDKNGLLRMRYNSLKAAQHTTKAIDALKEMEHEG
ncbi:peroxiredoxin [Antarcticibacterium arcticum]|uniref:thioredoxin-dependent peroxiredoxin n=1 Tax=Antarcticibacterium arcticum TaxID=2585771 RepID=A0A5B8YP46_9FLAO|nr:peroxiredoxin [Antarcticibacterium arcticum]QED37649.1 peroxiredoxin [Antarcticibacterium arcticum]